MPRSRGRASHPAQAAFIQGNEDHAGAWTLGQVNLNMRAGCGQLAVARAPAF
ncbi:MAG: hypothetical protein ACLGJB_15730 [Blastocatellia bacterium]